MLTVERLPRMTAFALVVLLVMCVSCDQVPRPQGEKLVKGKGPAGFDVNTRYAAAVKGPAEFRCNFNISGGKTFVLFRHDHGEWEPKFACNNAAGDQGSRFSLPGDGADWMITGWHAGTGAQVRAWKQCNFTAWQKEGDNQVLVCQTEGGGWMKLICSQGRCGKP